MCDKVDNISDLKKFRRGLFFCTFLFFAFIAWCTPLSSDDLVFSTIEGGRIADYLKFILEYGNGRLLGNIGAVVMNMFPLIAILVKASLLAHCCVLLPAILESQSIREYLLVVLLFVCMDPALFGETFAWTSGFGNYIPPIWMTMAIVRSIQRYEEQNSRGKRVGVCVTVCFLGVASQLYVEHTSGVNLLLALCAAGVCFKNRRAECKPCTLWLLSTAIGLGIMLLLPKIFYVPGNHADNYRYMNLDSITTMVTSAAKNSIKLIGAYFGPCMLTICGGAAASVYSTRNQRTDKRNKMMLSLCAVCAAYAAINLLLASARYMGKSAVIEHLFDALFLVVPLFVWVIAVWQMERGPARNYQLLCLLFAAISIAPLMVVSVVPNRVILQSYIFLMAAFVLVIRPMLAAVPERPLNRALISFTLIAALVVGNVFFSIRNMSQHRENYIRSQIASGSKSIEIFYIPYEYGSWDHIWIATYYGAERNNVEFVNIGFDRWMGSYYSLQ